MNAEAVAYVKLYRGLTSSFDSAILIKEVAGTFWYDKLETAIRYYYWIRIVSVNGTVGDLIGPASAVAKPTIAGMIELLTGQIDSGLLATTLKGQLDQISILNTNLLKETLDRQNDSTSLAQAIQDATDGVAAAHTYLVDAVNDLTTKNSAIIEQINGVAAAVGSDYGAVVQAMSVSIDALGGTVDAMYTAKLTVNGLIGGFGLTNDGKTVEAGFDVDTFWIGRTNANKRKPFIISDDVVYLDEAAINSLTFSKLRDESGSFVVSDNKVKASYIDTDGLIIRDAAGNAIFGAGVNLDSSLVNASSDWINSHISINADGTLSGAGTGQVTYTGIGGKKLGTIDSIAASNVSTYIEGAAIGTAQIALLSVGAAQIANLAVTSGKIANLAVDTLQVADNAINIPVSAFSASQITVSSSIDAQTLTITATGQPIQIFAGAQVAVTFGSYTVSGTTHYDSSTFTGQILRDGVVLFTISGLICPAQTGYSGILTLPPLYDTPAPGSHTYTIRISGSSSYNTHYASNRSLFVIEVKK